MLQKPQGRPSERSQTRSIPERPMSVRAICVTTRARSTPSALAVSAERSTTAPP
jgi:hypothetical protein